MIDFPTDPGHGCKACDRARPCATVPQRHLGLFRVRPLGAAQECGAGHDAEALMVLYGFLAGRGALSAARVDYSKASCWLWNVKCWDGPSRSVTGETLDLCTARSGSCGRKFRPCQKRMGLFSGTALQLLQGVPADPTFVALAAFCVRLTSCKVQAGEMQRTKMIKLVNDDRI